MIVVFFIHVRALVVFERSGYFKEIPVGTIVLVLVAGVIRLEGLNRRRFALFHRAITMPVYTNRNLPYFVLTP